MLRFYSIAYVLLAAACLCFCSVSLVLIAFPTEPLWQLVLPENMPRMHTIIVPPVDDPPPVEDPPSVEPPTVVDPPVTDPPTTEPPVIDPPVTAPPPVEPPVTDPPSVTPPTPITGGRVLVASTCMEQGDGHYHACLSRLNADGTTDTSYGENGFLRLNTYLSESGYYSRGDSHQLKRLADGRILLAGEKFTALLDADGNPVTSHGDNGILILPNNRDSGTLISIAVKDDGTITYLQHISRAHTTRTGLEMRTEVRIEQFNLDGTLQQSQTYYDRRGTETPYLPCNDNKFYTMALQNDGKVILAGEGTTCNSVPNLASKGPFIMRLNADFTVDSTYLSDSSTPYGIPTYGDGSMARRFITDVAIQDDGKTVAVLGPLPSTVQVGFYVLRFNTDGTLDQSFGGKTYDFDSIGRFQSLVERSTDGITYVKTSSPTYGAFAPAMLRDVEILDDGKIMAVGEGVLRLNTDGSLDENMSGDGWLFLAPGSPDAADGFAKHSYTYGPYSQFNVEPNGIITIQHFTGVVTSPRNPTEEHDYNCLVTRIHDDGNYDQTFNPESPLIAGVYRNRFSGTGDYGRCSKNGDIMVLDN